MFRILRLTTVFLPVFLLCSSFLHWGSDKLQARTEKRHFAQQNRHKCRRGPKRFMVIQKAATAQIKKHPDNENVLLIIFDNVDPYVAYYKVEPNRNYGILTIKQFMWYCHMGKSMFSKNNPRGAMGHLSFEAPNVSGEPLKFRVFQLNKPHYNKKENRLTYQIGKLPGFNVDDIQIGNVILTIDLSLS